MSNRNASCDSAKYIDNRSLAVPVDLYESVKGNYFVGCTDDLPLSDTKSCWARLYNPSDSCVNLHVNVWTITELASDAFRAEFWFKRQSAVQLLRVAERRARASHSVGGRRKFKMGLTSNSNFSGSNCGSNCG